MKTSKESDSLKISRFANLRNSVKKSKNGLVHYTFESQTHIGQNTNCYKMTQILSAPDVFEVTKLFIKFVEKVWFKQKEKLLTNENFRKVTA